jgi:hypothetical protein
MTLELVSCTYFGAEKTSKKTLASAQNIENKGSEIFPPPRSMVLKVVRGKILETLELALFPAAHEPVLALGRLCVACSGSGRKKRSRFSGCQGSIIILQISSAVKY